MNTSSSNLWLAWRIARYLFLRLCRNGVRFVIWLAVRSVQFIVGCLGLIASPAVSGRSQDEFKDLVQPDSSGGPPPTGGTDGFWRMYMQAYSPRLWRMRKLLPRSAGKTFEEDKGGDPQSLR